MNLHLSARNEHAMGFTHEVFQASKMLYAVGAEDAPYAVVGPRPGTIQIHHFVNSLAGESVDVVEPVKR